MTSWHDIRFRDRLDEIALQFECSLLAVTFKMVSLTDRVKNEEVLQRVNEERNILRTIKRMKANWIADILCRNCFLKHVIERKIEDSKE